MVKMHLRSPIVVLLTVAIIILALQPNVVLSSPENKVRIVVGLSSPLFEDRVEKALTIHGGMKLKVIREIDTLVAVVPEHKFENLSHELLSKQLARYVEFDVLYSIPEVDLKSHSVGEVNLVPNDPLYSLQWNLRRIDADKTWNLWMGSPDFIVGTIDTGADINHEDLSENLVDGYDFINNDPVPDDRNGHGTHVAGTIAAIIDNTEGVVGVAPSVKVMPVKALNAIGIGFSSDIADGIRFAVDNGAKVVSMSLGGSYSSVIRDATRYAVFTKSALVVAAAGNNGLNVKVYPCAFSWVICVAALGYDDTRASYSNFGSWIDISAPGGDTDDPLNLRILSTWPNNKYKYLAGTSMATPHVSGVAALYWSFYPSFTNRQVASLLILTADDIPPTGRDDYTGYGRVDAFPGDG